MIATKKNSTPQFDAKPANRPAKGLSTRRNRRVWRAPLLAGLVSLMALVLPSPAVAKPMNYTSWSEGAERLYRLAEENAHADIEVLGETSGKEVQLALRIRRAGTPSTKTANQVLFECGMHAREWLAAETCYWLIKDLVEQKADHVQELLDHVDVWVIPQTNPAGRTRDDPNHGDPGQFHRVCQSGPNIGQPCSVGCGGHPCSGGWRGNRNTTTCELGVDLARNFSHDWSHASSDCTLKYRGSAPFSEPETRNLRRFINNRMISMVVIVHGPDQVIDHSWYGAHDPSTSMTDELGNFASSLADAAGLASSALETLGGTNRLGDSSGQFLGWLSLPANRSGDADEGTERNISTFFLELPYHRDAYRTPYQDEDVPGNRYHPSGAINRDLWAEVLSPLYQRLVAQARFPHGLLDEHNNPRVAELLDDDFGLVGAKIGESSVAPGRIGVDPETRAETLAAGPAQIFFAVQRFGAVEDSTEAWVEISRDNVVEAATAVPIIGLSLGERKVFSVPHTFSAGHDYKVEIYLEQTVSKPDQFAKNDRKVFKFEARATAEAEPYDYLARLKLKLQSSRGGKPGRINAVLDTNLQRALRPDLEDLDIQLAGVEFWIAPSPEAATHTTRTWTIPGGAGWKGRAKADKHVWRYRSPEKDFRLVVKQKRDKKSGRWQTKLVINARSIVPESLQTSQFYMLSTAIPAQSDNGESETVRLFGITPGHVPPLPPMEDFEENHGGPQEPEHE